MNMPVDYVNLLQELKNEISSARVKASLAVNRELILLYWKIGKIFLQRSQNEKWGTKLVEKLSSDLQKSFPEMKGLGKFKGEVQHL